VNRPLETDSEGVPVDRALSSPSGSFSRTYSVLEPNLDISACGVQSESGAGLWPDLEYIRRRLSVRDVARELGLEVRGRSSARCWRTDAHQNGDRSPSLFFTRLNRCKCAVCDAQTMSNLDLIQAVLKCDLRHAVEWVTARWDVPDVPRGKHAKRREPQATRYRVGTTGLPFEVLVHSCLYRSLSKSAQILLPVILAFTDHETGWATMSYRALRQFAHLSFRGVSEGLRELRRIGLLEMEHGPRQDGAPLPSCNRYRLNFEAPAVLELQASTYRKHRAEIAFEVERQRERRNAHAGWAAARRINPRLQGRSATPQRGTQQLIGDLPVLEMNRCD
jgi:hypothetical protein